MTSPLQKRLITSARKTAGTFLKTAPVLVGVLLLAGLLNALTLPAGVMNLLAQNTLLGPLITAVVGSMAAGHPITSYVLGGELLAKGVGLAAVTALIVSWVTVGSVQLPVEMTHLGRRFGLVRNLIAFFSALAISYLTAATVAGFS